MFSFGFLVIAAPIAAYAQVEDDAAPADTLEDDEAAAAAAGGDAPKLTARVLTTNVFPESPLKSTAPNLLSRPC